MKLILFISKFISKVMKFFSLCYDIHICYIHKLQFGSYRIIRFSVAAKSKLLVEREIIFKFYSHLIGYHHRCCVSSIRHRSHLRHICCINHCRQICSCSHWCHYSLVRERGIWCLFCRILNWSYLYGCWLSCLIRTCRGRHCRASFHLSLILQDGLPCRNNHWCSFCFHSVFRIFSRLVWTKYGRLFCGSRGGSCKWIKCRQIL